MDKKSFAKTMDMIASAYCKSNLLEERILVTWYKFLGDYAESVFQDAAESYIKENNKCPAISDLHEICRDKQHIYDEELKRKQEEEDLIGDDEEWWNWEE